MGTGDRRSSQTPSFDGSPSPSDREVSTVSACDGCMSNVFELQLQPAEMSCSLPSLYSNFQHTVMFLSVCKNLQCVLLMLNAPEITNQIDCCAKQK